MDFNKEELVNDYTNYILNLPEGLKQIINSIEENEYDKLVNQLALFSEGIEWLHSVTRYLQHENLKFNIQDIADFLTIVVDSAEKQDYIMLSDIIEYELIPYFENLAVKN